MCYTNLMNIFKPHSKQYQYDYLLDTAPTSPERQAEYYSHMHNDYELLFFFGGDADYIIENQTYHLKKNDMLLIKPMVYHGIRILSAEPYERCVFNFAKHILSESQLKTIEEAGSVHHIENKSPIQNIFYALKQCENVFDKQEFEYLTKTSLHNLLAHLRYLPHGKRFSETKKDKLDEIIEYIHTHLELNLNTQILSKRFFVSTSWLDHNFKIHLNMAPKQYINQKKILYAQSLILSGMPIMEVFELCNYKNYTTFYRQYKNFLGCEPLQDRNVALSLGSNATK